MKLRNTNEYVRVVASFAMAGAVTAGTLMWLLPIQPSFDWRFVGAGLGALIAIGLFRRDRRDAPEN
jgi:hypothetical protein